MVGKNGMSRFEAWTLAVACTCLACCGAGCNGDLNDGPRSDLAARVVDGDMETASKAYGEVLGGEANEDTFWLVAMGLQRFSSRYEVWEWVDRWKGSNSFLERQAHSECPSARLLARMCLRGIPLEQIRFWVYQGTVLTTEPVWSSMAPLLGETVLLPVEEQLAILLKPVEFPKGGGAVTLAEAVKHIEKKTGMAVSIVPAEEFEKKSKIKFRMYAEAQFVGYDPRPVLDALLTISVLLAPPGPVDNYHAIVMTKDQIVLIRREQRTSELEPKGGA